MVSPLTVATVSRDSPPPREPVAPKTKSDLECPHGVQFYDVAAGSERSARAAWSYEAPKSSMMKVDHWFGFWEDVELT